MVQAMQGQGYRLVDHEGTQQAWIQGYAQVTDCNPEFKSRRNQAGRVLAPAEKLK